MKTSNPSNLPKLNQLGVTLIELIIVVVVIGVLSTLAITKFTQGNFSEKTRIARMHDVAVKLAAASRHAQNSEGLVGIDMTRSLTKSIWTGTADSANKIGTMQDYVTSIHEDIDIYVGYLDVVNALYNGDFNGDGTVSRGDDDEIWEFVDLDEVLILQDPEINDLAPLQVNDDVWLIVDQYGEVQYDQESWTKAKFNFFNVNGT